MKGGNETKQVGQKAATKTQNVAKFGVAAAKVFSGIASPKDWSAFIKGLLPFIISTLFFSIIQFVLCIAIILGPIIMATEFVRESTSGFSLWLEKVGNLFTFQGWVTDEEAFYNSLDDKYEYYKSKGADIPVEYVMSTLNYKYLSHDIDAEMGKESDYDDINDIEAEGADFGDMKSDMKRLMKHIVNEEGGTAEVSNNNFLSYLRYGKWSEDMGIDPSGNVMQYTQDYANKGDYTDGYIYKAFDEAFPSDISNKKLAHEIEGMISDIYSIAAAAGSYDPKYRRSHNEICKGSYSSAGTADIPLNDLNKIYVNVANSSCAQGSLENCNSWDYEMVPFKDYIIGVTYGENWTTNNEALKAQVVAAKSYTIGRISSMGRKWHEVNGNYVIYMLGSTSDQVYVDINTIDASIKSTISSAYDETVNDFIVNDNNEVVVASYCADFGVCNFCVKGNGTCFAQDSANRTVGQNYKEMLGYYYSAYKLYDMSNKTIQVSSVQCTTMYGSGQIRLPLDTFNVTSEWSPNRKNPVSGKWAKHSGIDLAANTGDPVYAIAPGKVIYSGWNGGYGNYVAIAHDINSDFIDDYVSVYAHNSQLLVLVGDKVSGGTQIAKAGSTGNSTGPHLHFEIRMGSTIYSPDVNPKQYLEDIVNGTSIFNSLITTELKYYNQGDYSSVAYCEGMMSGSKKATIQNSGCLPTAFAMVVAALKDGAVTPINIADKICSSYKNYRVEGSGTNSAILTDQSFLRSYGIKSSRVTSDYENKIIDALNNGKIIIVNVKGGTFNPSNGGHYIVLVGIENKTVVSVYDPGARERTKSYPISQITSNISNGIWIFE